MVCTQEKRVEFNSYYDLKVQNALYYEDIQSVLLVYVVH